MQIVTVIPITNSPLPETLSYYSRTSFSVGGLIYAPVGNKRIPGIISSSFPLSSARGDIKKATFALKKLERETNQTKKYPYIMRALEIVSEYFLVPKHHIAHCIFPQSILESERLPNIKKIHICPTWRQVEFLSQTKQKKALILHSNLTKNQQLHVLKEEEIDILITTPSFACSLLVDVEAIFLNFPNSEHYYRHRAPFFDQGFLIKELAKLAGKKIIEVTDDFKEGLTIYHPINTEQKFSYTLVIHTDILLYVKKLLESGEKVYIVAPRKGFAAGVSCLDCKKTALDKKTGERVIVVESNDGFYYKSNHGKTLARNTCQYCNGTRIKMFGFGIEALEKVLKRNFTDFPVYKIDQSTGKRLLKAVDKETGGIVLGTTSAFWHLKPKTYHTVFIGLEFLLGIPEGNQIGKIVRMVRRLETASKSFWTAIYQPKNEQTRLLAKKSYKNIFSKEDKLKKQFLMPPYGHFLSVEAKVQSFAIENLKNSIHNSIPKEMLIIETKPNSPGFSLMRCSISAETLEEVKSYLENFLKILPGAIYKINPRNL